VSSEFEQLRVDAQVRGEPSLCNITSKDVAVGDLTRKPYGQPTLSLSTPHNPEAYPQQDALMLSSTVSFFKTELMELQEDVTQVNTSPPRNHCTL